MKDWLKRWMYESGALSVYHWWRNKRTLTVVMFHRVLPREDRRWGQEDLAWTVSEDLLRDCLKFFKRHYTPITLERLLQAVLEGTRLPDHALLITFDDGWADNYEYALPLLQQEGLSAVVFVVAGGVGRAELLENAFQKARRTGRLSTSLCNQLWRAATGGCGGFPPWNDPRQVRELAWRVSGLEDGASLRIAAEVCAGSGVSQQMLSADHIRKMYSVGIAIGSHGHTHTPIPLARDPDRELKLSGQVLAEILGTTRAGIATFSFPHGQYDERSLQLALDAGYRILFTSDFHLHSTRNLLGAVFGRINIPAHLISDPGGRLRPERLALWLFGRPILPAASAGTS
ncbi:MAG: polysaccharide deacetylase family protein [Acidobacteria bacterium]|nr:polysaccharide deacetylase family protein [Acidobacteriota bacterium]